MASRTSGKDMGCTPELMAIPRDVRKGIMAAPCIAAMIFVGGWVFNMLESPSERERLREWEAYLANFSASRTELEMQEIRDFVARSNAAPVASEMSWDFTSASWFCLTLLTTIGYGTFAPSTGGGKLFLVLYGPLTIKCHACVFAIPGAKWAYGIHVGIQGWASELWEFFWCG